MSYGANRKTVLSDTFDSSIGSNWAQLPDMSTNTWVTGGHVRCTNNNADASLIANTGTFLDEQWSRVTIQQMTDIGSGGADEIWAVVRQSSGQSACYLGVVTDESTKYQIVEVSSGDSWTYLHETGTGAALSAGDTVTLEAEGSVLRIGTNEGSGDTLRFEWDDTTHTTGVPGGGCWVSNTATNCLFTAIECGNIGQSDDFNSINAVSAAASGASTTQSLPAWDNTAGNLLVVGIKWEDASRDPTISDTAGNGTNWVAGPVRNLGGNVYERMFYCLSCVGDAANVVTVEYGSFTSLTKMCGQQFSASGSVSFVGENYGTNTGTTVSASSLGNAAGDLSVSILGEYAAGSWTEDAGYSVHPNCHAVNSSQETVMQYKLVSAANETPGGTYSASTSLISGGMAFTLAAGWTPESDSPRTLQQVSSPLRFV